MSSPRCRKNFGLSKAQKFSQRTKDRTSAIRLSPMGWKVEKITIYLKWAFSIVRTTIDR